jgi:hypothetical protein
MGIGALLTGVNAVAAKQNFHAPVTSLGLSALAQADWEQTAEAARAATVGTGRKENAGWRGLAAARTGRKESAADAVRISASMKEQARRDGARADAEQKERQERQDAEDRRVAEQAIVGRYRDELEDLGMSADEAPASGGGFFQGLGKAIGIS